MPQRYQHQDQGNFLLEEYHSETCMLNLADFPVDVPLEIKKKLSVFLKAPTYL